MLPIGTVESVTGRIVAIIDEDGYVRIKHRLDHHVEINLCNRNHMAAILFWDTDFLNGSVEKNGLTYVFVNHEGVNNVYY